jgi:predicted unusual protein kinase regulating ubiquinone biosynthesis (AarF/ABC1/UbiB family)/nucleotide-binding universal stress UspA family protein
LVKRILVATDRSGTASKAVEWAAQMADRFAAELVLLQVLVPHVETGTETGAPQAALAREAETELVKAAERVAGARGRARVVVDPDPAMAIVNAAEDEDVDVVVVGNVGMSGRREFLLGNVPNRVSHNARRTVIIVNTGGPMEARLGEAPPSLEEQPAPPVGHLLRRATRIAQVMGKFGIRELFTPAPGDEGAIEENERERARRLRAALEELGPTFAKLGQILSTRPDLLPPAFIEELATLQDRVTPMSEEEVVRVMEQELRVPWEDVFENIDPQPLASGTIAQVHRATLETGDRVVVKVQRPTARDEILQDLGLLEEFAKRTEDRPAFTQVFDMPTIIDHLSSSLRRELDFRQEAANIERMRQVLEPFPRLDVPGVYGDFSTERLLVMEEIPGGPITRAEGQARKEAARQLLESYYRQILTDGFFHADPHPGNLMWCDDKIYFLDFGMVGEVDAGTRELLILLLMAFAQNDLHFLTDVTLMLAGEDQAKDIDLQGFEEDLGTLLERYRGMSLKEIQLGPILQEMTEISIRHDVRLPASMALTGKALAQMQLATAELDPELDPFDVAGQYVVKRLTGQVRDRMDPRRLFYEAQKMRVRLTRLLEAVERLSGARPGPKLQVHFRGIEGLETTIHRAGRRLALAFTAAGALLGTAITATSTRVAGWVPIVLAVAGGVLALGLVADLLRGKR